MYKRHKRITVVFVGLLVLINIAVSFKNIAYIPPVLIYHSILPGSPKDSLTVSIDAFERQMHFLKSRHYNVVPLISLADLIKNKKKIPPRTVAITFDDGRKDNYTYAFQILKKFSLPATIFIIVNEVARADRVDWEEILQMKGSGVIDIGSHTLDHIYLTKEKSAQEVRRQVFESKKVLEERLKSPVTSFSYPVGGFSPAARQAVVEAGYSLAVAISPGKRFAKDDVFLLKRIKITEKDKNEFIFWFKCSGYYTFLKELFSHKKKDYGY